jgi:uncharacterized protein
MRLELGAGYPGSYDWLAEDVVDGAILPRFRDGQLAEGIEAGVDDTITRIVAPFTEGRPPEPQPAPAPRPVASGDTGSAGGGFGIFGALFAAVFVGIGALVLRRPIGNLLTRFKACPQCGRKALSRQSKTVTPATRTATGLRRTTTTCASCGWHDVKDTTLSMVSDRDSSSNSGSGGSFGGGSSSGGGASGKW